MTRTIPTHAEEPKPKRKIYPDEFKRRYGLTIIIAAAFTLYTILLCANVSARTERRIRQELSLEYSSRLEQYKLEQAQAVQASYWQSGEASRESFMNQEIQRGARFITKETQGDKYKATKLGVAIARAENSGYPSSLQEVMDQEGQWIRYSPDSTVTQHDIDLAESILRPYYEQGILPADLTDEFVFFNTDTGVARNTWNVTSSTRTWEYHG